MLSILPKSKGTALFDNSTVPFFDISHDRFFPACTSCYSGGSLLPGLPDDLCIDFFNIREI